MLEQVFDDFELIVCDNCSTDESWAVISSFADTRVKKYRHSMNMGMYKNLNYAVSRAQEKYIKFLNSDDVMHPDCLLCISLAIRESSFSSDLPNYVGHRLVQSDRASPAWLA